MMQPQNLTRRSVLAGLSAVCGTALIGCGSREGGRSEPAGPTEGQQTANLAQPAAMTVFRDPSCGCCEAWAEIARNAGYQVRLVDHPDMPGIKRQYGVPDALLSCHTTIIGGYAVEGHVPLQDVQRLLAQRPSQLSGIAVGGMPLGSPGMEVPAGTKEKFQVMAFDRTGRISAFQA